MTIIDAPAAILSLQTQGITDLIARVPAHLPETGARFEQILDAIYGDGEHDAQRVAMLAVAIAELLRSGIISREKQGGGYVYQRTRGTARGLVMDGMKTTADWGQLGFEGKVNWLATLTPIGIRGQASVLAATGRRPVEQVVSSWVYLGYLPVARAQAALAVEVNAAAGGERGPQ